MVAHALEQFPEESANIGAPNLEEFVQNSIAKAAGYGIEGRADVAQFLSLHLMFGAQFDHEYAWASEILGNPSVTASSAKIALLNEAATHELQRKKLR